MGSFAAPLQAVDCRPIIILIGSGSIQAGYDGWWWWLDASVFSRDALNVVHNHYFGGDLAALEFEAERIESLGHAVEAVDVVLQ